jgi:uncharacterized membrane protein (DUF4010 family)
VLYPRVLVASAILNRAVVAPLLPYLVPPALVAAMIAAAGARRSPAPAGSDVSPGNPLQLGAALQMVVLFQAVLMAVFVARQLWGTSGVFTSAAVLGLTDVDALTLSMTRDVAQTISPAIAAAAIAVGVLTNTAMKLMLALFLGSGRFRVLAGGALLLMLVALGAILALRLPLPD